MEKIAIDTIGPIDEDFGLKYIIVVVDCFTSYVGLFPEQEVSIIAAVDALYALLTAQSIH